MIFGLHCKNRKSTGSSLHRTLSIHLWTFLLTPKHNALSVQFKILVKHLYKNKYRNIPSNYTVYCALFLEISLECSLELVSYTDLATQVLKINISLLCFSMFIFREQCDIVIIQFV